MSIRKISVWLKTFYWVVLQKILIYLYKKLDLLETILIISYILRTQLKGQKYIYYFMLIVYYF